MSSAAQTPIAALWTAVGDCYSSTNPPPAGAVLAVKGVYAYDAGTLSAALADAGKLVIITGSGSEAKTTGARPVFGSIASPPADGLIVRVANAADPTTGFSITLNNDDGDAVAEVAQGEVCRLQWWADTSNSGANKRWLKIPGV